MIPFNRPYLTGHEFTYIQEAVAAGQLAGNGASRDSARRGWSAAGRAARAAHALLHGRAGDGGAAARIEPGDEVIMPSFTFVSTANAFVLRGATPVFVDIRPDTLNLDERLIEAAITPRTRAIVAVHYAGVACEMDAILDIAARHGLVVVEDAAQALMSPLPGPAARQLRPPGGVQLPRDEERDLGRRRRAGHQRPAFVERAEIIWEKGTNRVAVLRGEVDKYTWVDVGSSFLPGELTAAFLWAQLEERGARSRATRLASGTAITRPRLHSRRRPAAAGRAGDCEHNAHMYYLLLPCRRSATTSSPTSTRRHQRGVSLRPAALVARRPALRPRVRFDERHRRLQRASDPIAALGGDAGEHRR